MTKPATNPSPAKSKPLRLVEYVLLGLCLCLIALRVTFTEGATAQSPTLPANLTDAVYSLSVSAILIFSFLLWFALSFCSRRFMYRLTGIEIGLCIFCAAAVISGFAASDKRLTITNIAVSLAPILCAVLLVQILDSPSKVKLVLAVIAAAGIVTAYQCAEQFFSSNQMTVEQYERDPESLLEPLGIEAGTFQHFLFEHRLYSRGVRGFFTTRNSAGSFLLMALFAAVALSTDKLEKDKGQLLRSVYLLVCGAAASAALFAVGSLLLMAVFVAVALFIGKLFACGAAVGIILFALFLTVSKGAIVGLFFAVTVFIALLYFGNQLRPHRRTILLGLLLLAAAGGWAVISYGLEHGELPGGNSMLVRWQYWHASAKMYAGHPLTGVGPGNFAHFYQHYKPPSAIESVADPHNFPLAILTQYGPLGLIAFLAMIFVPMWRTVSSNTNSLPQPPSRQQPSFRTLPLAYLAVTSAVLLFVRPTLTSTEPVDNVDVLIYVALTMYVMPVVAFIVGFLLITAPLRTTSETRLQPQDFNTTTVAIFCALLGVMLHNLIDFAIFEPGVYTAFWAMIACLVSISCRCDSRRDIVLRPAPLAKTLVVVAVLLIVWAYLYYALVPVGAATSKIRQAHRALSTGRFQSAHALLAAAADDDRLSPAALGLSGRLHMERYDRTEQTALLEKASECFRSAIERNPEHFKNYEKLSAVYDSLGQTQKAYEYCLEATRLYPGSGRLRLNLARAAEKLGRTDVALENYSKAVEIEDSYRRQFQRMYPERKEIVSRLGDEDYRFAEGRIKQLTQ
ncbi:MAG: O-antigen ligase family protein [Phycisphaerales bacterium]|nr:MAG: O-antigen ligase family protein [Phycisphaerales bacterium]